MKKSILSLMMAGALLTSGTIFAQTETDATTGATQQTENAQKGPKGRPGMGKKANRPQKFNPFDGLQLTDDQQQRLQELQKGLGPVELSPEQQAKIPENKNLTEEQKKVLQDKRKADRLEPKKKYLNGVKEILTPEQYVIFLENVYLYAPQDQGQGNRPRGGKNFQGHKGGKPAQKPAETPAANQ